MVLVVARRPRAERSTNTTAQRAHSHSHSLTHSPQYEHITCSQWTERHHRQSRERMPRQERGGARKSRSRRSRNRNRAAKKGQCSRTRRSKDASAVVVQCNLTNRICRPHLQLHSGVRPRLGVIFIQPALDSMHSSSLVWLFFFFKAHGLGNPPSVLLPFDPLPFPPPLADFFVP